MTATTAPAEGRPAARRAVRQHDPHARDGRGAEGELRPSRHADGARPDRLRPLHARHAPRARAPRLAQPRPLRPERRPRVDAALRDAPPHRLRALARRHQELPPAATRPPPATPSTATRPASRRRPARSARASRCAPASRSASGCSTRASATTSSTTTRSRIASDGDMQEGISGEAGSLAGHLKLGRLVAFYDDNHISIEGDTALAFSEDVGKRYEAYGWHVQNLGEDLALDRIEQAARDAMAVEDRPSLIIVRTHIAPGSPNKQDTEAAHGSPLGEEEVRLTKQAYGWDPDKQFYVPDEALAHFRECDRARQRARVASGSSAPAAGRASRCPTAGTTTCRRSRRATCRRSPRARPAARSSSGRRRRCPHLVGGSADLAALDAAGDGRARSSPAPTTGASCTSASASTRWARPSTASCLAASARSARAS